ncbi:hypothetical protein K466DRAFT_314592 [Polyporus arcularius HHB13444]|uniref:Uncharacterized protein n=1 Tax=Polyporus arcularius HHB13444 TaxID=1314778 RepID=A0A5C3NXU1_9APHY|nr:hypothetical protein K466DRAFT_314592 [Polyporus arcularius HHB13444]
MCMRLYAPHLHSDGLYAPRTSASSAYTFLPPSSEAAICLINLHCEQVSDADGFGTGGTSSAVTVLGGEDGCFDPTKVSQAPWNFHIDPDGILTTCSPTRIWWNDGDPQGTPQFQGIIPGGQSFDIPVGSTTPETGKGIGFNWTPSVRISTTLLLIGGDSRGPGVAGSNVYTLQQGNSQSCLNGSSPSSTPGSPAGGSYPTSTDGSGVNSGGGGGGGTNIGAIVGGVIGGVVGAIAIALILLFVMRRRRFHQSVKERPVDLLQDGDGDGDGRVGDGRLPEYYQPEPFVLPDPTAPSTHDSSSAPGTRLSGSARPSTDRRESFLSATTSDNAGGGYLRAGSSAPSTSARKSPAPPSFRAVNIIQHDDAGLADPPPLPEQEPETIELPPAYTNIRRDAGGPVAGEAQA